MTDPDYEIMPHQLLEDLKYDVEALKKQLSRPDAKINELILEIETLKDTIHDLTDIFTKSLEEIRGEENAGKSLGVMKEKIASVVTQNEIIARGMVAISDKLDKWMSSTPHKPATAPGVMQHNAGFNHGPARVAPRPPMPVMDFPPPPPSARKGMFR